MFAGKITVHPDDTFSADQIRVDMQHPSTLTDEGKNMWISGHYLLPEDAGGREEFAFFESNSTFQNVMDFWFDAKQGGGTTINFGVGFLGQTKLWTADFTKGVWHQVAIHVLWSTNAQTGSVDVWLDGTKVVDAKKAKTKADGNSLFFQTGLHRRMIYNVTTTDTLYLDDFVEADNEADAKIAAPTQNTGGGGGSAGAAGAAGAGGGSTGGVGGSSSPIGGAGGAAQFGAGMGGMGGSAGPSNIAGVYMGDGAANIAGTATTAPTPATTNDSSGCSLGAVDKTDGTVSVLLGLLGLAALRGVRRRR
jgi:MYXO-CTERM domain-containing protein